MYETLSPIFHWMNTHPNLAGLATLLISTAESVAIIGTIIPGTVMMTAIGTLAGAGVIPLYATLLWAILGAILGDGISYWLGRHFKERLNTLWPFKNYPNLLTNGKHFIHKHGSLSVIIGRFVGPVRALVPLVAGTLGMRPLHFTLANIISAIGWAPAYMLPGIVLGAASLELPPDIAVHFILKIVLITLFVTLCCCSLYKLLILIRYQIEQFLRKLWKFLNHSCKFLTIALQHHQPEKAHRQLILAFYLLSTASIFCYLAVFIFHLPSSSQLPINNIFYHLFRSLRTPLGDKIMIYISLFGDKQVILPLALTLSLWFAIKKRWHTAFHTFALGTITPTCLHVLKIVVHSLRPGGIVHSPSTLSFPSGHATLAITFYTVLALLLTHHRAYRKVAVSIAVLLTLAVSCSRLYLGAHWLTDILGAWLLGLSFISLICLSYNRRAEKPFARRGVVLIALLTLIFTYSYSVCYRLTQLEHDYQLPTPQCTQLTISTWWGYRTNRLPVFRTSRIGAPAEIFNLQWLEEPTKIQKTLLAHGWAVPSPINGISVLHRLADVESTAHIPLLNALYLDQAPILTLTKFVDEKKLLVLRFWQTNTRIGTQQLLIGSITAAPRTYSWLMTHLKPEPIIATPELLFAQQAKHYRIKSITLNLPVHLMNKYGDHPHILLIKPNSL